MIRAGAVDPAKRVIRLAAPHVYGLMQGNPSPRRWRALNVLEELDRPGEFVIDRLHSRLYVWPERKESLALSTLDAPLIKLDHAHGGQVGDQSAMPFRRCGITRIA